MKRTYQETVPGICRVGKSSRSISHGLMNAVLAVFLFAAGASTAFGAIRVGPIDETNGFPMFYEDETGLRLDLCTDPANCFFGVPDPLQPTVFPTNYPDEAFYWAADSIMIEPGNVKAVLVLAREAAFFNDAVVPGDQVTFSRIRLFIDGATQMIGNTYQVTTPYNTFSFVSEPGDAGPGAKGPGLSFTQDVGLGAPLQFDGAMAQFPTFLIPASMDRATLINSPGTLLTPVADTQVQGSPTGNNFFRIEGPEIATVYPSYQCADATLGGVKDAAGADVLTDCVELDRFTMSGRVASRHGVDIDRNVYEKINDPIVSASPITYVNVWARSVEGQTLGVRVDGGPQVQMAEGVGGHYFVRLQEGIDYAALPAGQRKPLVTEVANLTDLPFISKTSQIHDHLSITASPLTTDTAALQVIASSSNKVDTALLSIDSTSTQPLVGTLTDTGLGTVTGTYTIGTTVEVGVPPLRIGFDSLEGGHVSGAVNVSGTVINGGFVPLLTANAGVDQSLIASTSATIVQLSGADSLGNIATYQWSTLSTLGFACADTACSQIEVFTPDAGTLLVDQLVAEFTLTVIDAAGASSVDNVLLTVTHHVVQVADFCTIATSEHRADKDSWRVEGISDIPNNQLVSVYAGSIAFDPLSSIFVGEARVDAIGDWDLRTAEGDSPAPAASDTLVWIESELGCQETADLRQR